MRLFIASKSVEHDGTRRVLAVGRTRGGSSLVQLCARFGDIEATGTREAAQIEAVRQAGYRAWELHHGQRGETAS